MATRGYIRGNWKCFAQLPGEIQWWLVRGRYGSMAIPMSICFPRNCANSEIQLCSYYQFYPRIRRKQSRMQLFDRDKGAQDRSKQESACRLTIRMYNNAKCRRNIGRSLSRVDNSRAIHDDVQEITMPYVCIMPDEGRGLFAGVKQRKQKCGVFRR